MATKSRAGGAGSKGPLHRVVRQPDLDPAPDPDLDRVPVPEDLAEGFPGLETRPVPGSQCRQSETGYALVCGSIGRRPL